MNFLPDVYVEWKPVRQTFNRETLNSFQGKSISDVLNMTVDEAVPFFEMIRKFTAGKNNSRCRFRIHHAGSAKHHTFGWRPNA
jgi:hypothetical protein